MRHDQAKPKTEKTKRKLVPIEKRRTTLDCEPGDVVRFEDGREAVVTAWFNGGPGGRWLDASGDEGELTALPNAMVTRLRGIR